MQLTRQQRNRHHNGSQAGIHHKCRTEGDHYTTRGQVLMVCFRNV